MKHFKTGIIIGVLAIIVTFVASSSIIAYSSNTSYSYDDMDELLSLMKPYTDKMNSARQMEEAALELGYSENHYVIQLARQEYQDAEEACAPYQEIYDSLEARWTIKEQEYPEATQIWTYLKNLGYNDYVCAGILGNIMAEAGGSTLNIQPLVQGGFYGICQWNQAYSEVWGASLEEQLDFLRDTIEYELDTFGYAYGNDFDYGAFLQLTDEKDAALAFSKCYERNAPSSYNIRQVNATKALEYFTS